MAVVVILVLLAVGSVLFHLLSPWWVDPDRLQLSYIDNTITITFWITGIAFTAVVLFMAYCVCASATDRQYRRLRARKQAARGWLATARPSGVAAMLAPGLFVWNQFVTVPQDASEVEVIGQQWLGASGCPAGRQAGTTETRDIAPKSASG